MFSICSGELGADALTSSTAGTLIRHSAECTSYKSAKLTSHINWIIILTRVRWHSAKCTRRGSCSQGCRYGEITVYL
jgi:hypothetical protein